MKSKGNWTYFELAGSSSYVVSTAQKKAQLMATATRTRTAKKTIGLVQKNKNFAPASRFFVHFSTVIPRLRHENANFTFCGGREQDNDNDSRKNCQHLTN